MLISGRGGGRGVPNLPPPGGGGEAAKGQGALSPTAGPAFAGGAGAARKPQAVLRPVPSGRRAKALSAGGAEKAVVPAPRPAGPRDFQGQRPGLGGTAAGPGLVAGRAVRSLGRCLSRPAPRGPVMHSRRPFKNPEPGYGLLAAVCPFPLSRSGARATLAVREAELEAVSPEGREKAVPHHERTRGSDAPSCPTRARGTAVFPRGTASEYLCLLPDSCCLPY